MTDGRLDGLDADERESEAHDGAWRALCATLPDHPWLERLDRPDLRG